jgi:hypothetical protein
VPDREPSETDAARAEIERIAMEDAARSAAYWAERSAWYQANYPGGHRAQVPFTDDLLREYLETLEQTGVLIAAADRVGICHVTALQRRKDDESFALAVDAALERYRKRIVAAVYQRGVEGVIEPIYQGGSFVGTKRVYSDRLLELLARAKIAEFREAGKAIQVEHKGEVNHRHTAIAAPEAVRQAAASSPEKRAALRALLGDGAADNVLDVEARELPAATISEWDPTKERGN